MSQPDSFRNESILFVGVFLLAIVVFAAIFLFFLEWYFNGTGRLYFR